MKCRESNEYKTSCASYGLPVSFSLSCRY